MGLELHEVEAGRRADRAPSVPRALGAARGRGAQPVGRDRGRPLRLDRLDRGGRGGGLRAPVEGRPAAYVACLATQPRWQDVTGTYRFVLPAPPKPPGAGRLTRAWSTDGGRRRPVGRAAGRRRRRDAEARLVARRGRSSSRSRSSSAGRRCPRRSCPQHLHISFRSPLDPSTCDAAGVWGLCSTQPGDRRVPAARDALAAHGLRAVRRRSRAASPRRSPRSASIRTGRRASR